MSDLDLAKALAGDDGKPYAYVVYGEALTDTGTILQDGEVVEGYENFLTVAIDNYASSVDMYCETAVKAGDRLRIVLDPSGRYLVYAASEQVDELQGAIKNLENETSEQIDGLQEAIENLEDEINSGEDTKVTQTSTSSTATAYDNNYPILFKYETGSSTVTDVSRIASTITANPFGSGTITAGTFAGNARTASKWYSQRQLICTDDSVVLGSSDLFSGAGGEGSQGNGCPYIYLSFNPNIAGDGISVSATKISLATAYTASTYGLTSNIILKFDGSGNGRFEMPYITTDAYGRVSGGGTRILTLPQLVSGDNISIDHSETQITISAAFTNTDTLVKQKNGADNDSAYPILLKNDTGTSGDITAECWYGGDVIANPKQGAIRATDYYVNTKSGDNPIQFHGIAESADMLDRGTVGYSWHPVYFRDGVPTICTSLGPFDDFDQLQLTNTNRMSIDSREILIYNSGTTEAGALLETTANNGSAFGCVVESGKDASYVGLNARSSADDSTVPILRYVHLAYSSYAGDTIHFFRTCNFRGNTITYSVLDGINVLREDSEAQTLSAKEDADIAYTPGTSVKLSFVAPLKIEDGAITEWADVELTFRDGVLTDIKYPEDYMKEV